MKRFVEGEDRRQGVLLPEFLDEYVSDENPVRVIDVFVEELDLGVLGFAGVVPEATGRPAYHPGVLLKIYVPWMYRQVKGPSGSAKFLGGPSFVCARARPGRKDGCTRGR